MKNIFRARNIGITFWLAVHASATISAADFSGYFQQQSEQSLIPSLLSEREEETFKRIFNAIDAQEWALVEGLIASESSSLLYAFSLAEYYTHPNSPIVNADAIRDWLVIGRTLPQAERLRQLGLTRGLTRDLQAPELLPMSRAPSRTRRSRPPTIRDGTMPEDFRDRILMHISNDRPDLAMQLLEDVEGRLSGAALAEWRQRVAWSFYIENDSHRALEIAQTVADGNGDWVAEGEWVGGLASWRLGDCELASESFNRAANTATEDELRAAAFYWAYRSLLRCENPREATEQLHLAAQYDETFYGMLAFEQLGQVIPPDHEESDLRLEEWLRVKDHYNIRVAIALAEIGETDAANEVLQHQAKIGDPNEFVILTKLARELGLPRTQLWLAINVPFGSNPLAAANYPIVKWKPLSGWRIDPALAFALALQESSFRENAISPANARGLMQITPITLREHAGRLNMNAQYVDLNDPSTNLTFGQQNLEMLRDSPATDGLLPKVLAAYNAGLLPVTKWNQEINDQDDPLLYMESIPYWETRGYVNIVIRNYWMYERQAGPGSESRRALAEGRWPKFPISSPS